VLLRRTVAALHAAGHRVRLVAPSTPARVLVGPGPGEVEEALPWDGPETAALLAGERTRGPLFAALDAAEVVVALTRSGPVLEVLHAFSRRVLAHDPAPPLGGPHASLWLAQSLSPLGLFAGSNPPPPLSFSVDERRQARERTGDLLDGFLAVHPGSGSPDKNWPAERFVELARRLSDARPWLLVQGPAEERMAVPPDAIVARDWPLRLLGATLARAALFVGNDSGVAHLAAASGAPTLTLFGPTDPAIWAPVGPSVASVRAPGGVLTGLSVDAVVAAALALRSTVTARR
jgi:hypothetical protein